MGIQSAGPAGSLAIPEPPAGTQLIRFGSMFSLKNRARITTSGSEPGWEMPTFRPIMSWSELMSRFVSRR